MLGSDTLLLKTKPTNPNPFQERQENPSRAPRPQTTRALTKKFVQASFERWLGSQPPSAKSWIKTLGQDSHTAGRLVLVPSSVADEGRQEGGEVSLSEVAFCLGEGDDSAGSPFSLCALREKVGERVGGGGAGWEGREGGREKER